MTNKEKLEITSRNKKLGIIFTPKKVQIDHLAHRLTPEIKKYFANEMILKEFAEWDQSHSST